MFVRKRLILDIEGCKASIRSLSVLCSLTMGNTAHVHSAQALVCVCQGNFALFNVTLTPFSRISGVFSFTPILLSHAPAVNAPCSLRHALMTSSADHVNPPSHRCISAFLYYVCISLRSMLISCSLVYIQRSYPTVAHF